MENDTKKITIEEFEEQLKSRAMEECEYLEFGRWKCQWKYSDEFQYGVSVWDEDDWDEEAEQDEFKTVRVRGDEDLARQADAWQDQMRDAWMEQKREEGEAWWYGMIVGVDVVLAEGRDGPIDDIDFETMAAEAVKNNPGKYVCVVVCMMVRDGKEDCEEDYETRHGMRYVFQDWRTTDGGYYSLCGARFFGEHNLYGPDPCDPSLQQSQRLYRTEDGEMVLVCEGGAATPWGITDKDGYRKPATLLIPLKKEEAELWKNHELDDDALMKIALSFKDSVE